MSLQLLAYSSHTVSTDQLCPLILILTVGCDAVQSHMKLNLTKKKTQKKQFGWRERAAVVSRDTSSQEASGRRTFSFSANCFLPLLFNQQPTCFRPSVDVRRALFVRHDPYAWYSLKLGISKFTAEMASVQQLVQAVHAAASEAATPDERRQAIAV